MFVLCLAVLPFASLLGQKGTDELVVRSLNKGKIEMLIPLSFSPMDSTAMAGRFTKRLMPEDVYCDANQEIMLGLGIQSLSEGEALDSMQLKMDTLAMTFQQVRPKLKVVQYGVVKQNEREFGFLEFIDHEKPKVYSLMYIVVVDGQGLLFTFRCPLSDAKSWKKSAKKMMASIKVIEG